jgi:hypothetical protein
MRRSRLRVASVVTSVGVERATAKRQRAAAVRAHRPLTMSRRRKQVGERCMRLRQGRTVSPWVQRSLRQPQKGASRRQAVH